MTDETAKAARLMKVMDEMIKSCSVRAWPRPLPICSSIREHWPR